jgi:predicted dehydrogenase
MIVFDDIEPTEKVKVYDTSFRVNTEEAKNKVLIDYRVGDIFTPKVDLSEALTGVCDDFLCAVTRGKELGSHWQDALSVIKILEAADASINQRGKEVKLR